MTQKLSFLEKAGYSGADAAANFVFMTMVLFQLNFYTDTFGLTAGAAAAILHWPRLWDAVVDPMLRVRGIEGLRVIDASVMPTVTSANTNAAALMIGEKGADLVLNPASQ